MAYYECTGGSGSDIIKFYYYGDKNNDITIQLGVGVTEGKDHLIFADGVVSYNAYILFSIDITDIDVLLVGYNIGFGGGHSIYEEPALKLYTSDFGTLQLTKYFPAVAGTDKRIDGFMDVSNYQGNAGIKLEAGRYTDGFNCYYILGLKI